MLTSEKILERLEASTGVYDYFLGEPTLNALMKEAENTRFDERQLVLEFKGSTAVLSSREQITITNKSSDGAYVDRAYDYRVESWGEYNRVGTPCEERMFILL